MLDSKMQFMTMLDAVYQQHSKTLPKQVLDLICMTLESEGIDYNSALQGVIKHNADPDAGKWPPTAAHIIAQVSGGKDSKAYQAWEQVLKACRTKDAIYRGIVFADLKITEAIDMLGGWQSFYEAVHHAERTNDTWVRKNFLDAYKAATGRKNKIAEGKGMNGRKLKPIQIGNPEACAKIIQASRQIESKVELPAIQAATL